MFAYFHEGCNINYKEKKNNFFKLLQKMLNLKLISSEEELKMDDKKKEESFTEKIKEGVSVQELENFARKYTKFIRNRQGNHLNLILTFSK